MKHWKSKTAILSICFVTLIYLVISVSVAGLMESFPTVPESTVMLVLTLPALTSILGFVAVPVLLKRFCTKTVALAGLFLMLFGGIACLLFSTKLAVLIGAGVVMGIAYGILSTMYPLLVDAYFTGEERTFTMGIATGALQLGRLSATFVAGFLAESAWVRVYDTFLLVVVAIVLVALLLPKQAQQQQRTAQDMPDKKTDRGEIAKLCIVGALFAAVYFLTSTHVSLYIEGYGLGTPAVTGTVTAATSAVALVSFFFSRIYRFTKEATLPVALGAMGLGFLLTGTVVSLWSMCVGLALAAFSMALFSPYVMLKTTGAAGTGKAPIVTAVVLTCINFGYFVSPYVTQAASDYLGDGSVRMAFLFGAIAALLLTTLLGAMLLFQRQVFKKQAQ